MYPKHPTDIDSFTNPLPKNYLYSMLTTDKLHIEHHRYTISDIWQSK